MHETVRFLVIALSKFTSKNRGKKFQKAQTEHKSRAGKLGGKIGKQQLGPKNPNWFIEKKMGRNEAAPWFCFGRGQEPNKKNQNLNWNFKKKCMNC